MDLAMFLITMAAVIVAMISAVIAWIQRGEAQQARIGAKDEADRSAAAAERAATAAEESSGYSARMAAALEARNKADAARDAARIPWSATREQGSRWRITNETGARAEFVQLESGDAQIQVEDGRDWRDVERAAPIFVDFGGGLTDPPTANVTVSWRDRDREHQEFSVVLG